MSKSNGGEGITQHPMIPFLTGWLLGDLMRQGGEIMKITRVVPDGHAAFDVHLASGLVLRVQVSEKEPEDKP